MKKFKKGAASFYIVAFSTLILVIIAASFSAVVLSELARSANDDLSQSAYDAALAGVEDAKVAFYNYQKCLEQQGVSASKPNEDNVIDCGEIIWLAENPDCNMVAKILGRIKENEDREVLIEENTVSSGGASNNMQQAYTCTYFNSTAMDYRASLTSGNSTKAVKVQLGDGINANQIKTVKVSWFLNNNKRDGYIFSNITTNEKVVFPQFRGDGSNLATPPMISVGLVQTGGDSFKMEDFTKVEGNNTNRGTVFLVPTNDAEIAERKGESVEFAYKNERDGNYFGAYRKDEGRNVIMDKWITKTNDQNVKNLPFVVYCGDEASEFACSATLVLPEPIGGDRNNNTFMFVLSLPYGQPDTDFALEFFCAEGITCGKQIISKVNEEGEETSETIETSQANLKNMQVTVDSTGRANNLFRRVEVRLEAADSFFPYPLFAIELLDDSKGKGESTLTKPGPVTSEWGL